MWSLGENFAITNNHKVGLSLGGDAAKPFVGLVALTLLEKRNRSLSPEISEK